MTNFEIAESFFGELVRLRAGPLSGCTGQELCDGLELFSSLAQMESLIGAWMEWRNGPLAECSPDARELLFLFFDYVRNGSPRGYLGTSGGAPGAIADLVTFGETGVVGEWLDLDALVAELRQLGFLARSPRGEWFSPQMAAGEI